MTDKSYRFIALIGVILAGHAAYWFIGGRSVGASEIRIAAVVIQIAVGFAFVLWSWVGRRKTLA